MTTVTLPIHEYRRLTSNTECIDPSGAMIHLNLSDYELLIASQPDTKETNLDKLMSGRKVSIKFLNDNASIFHEVKDAIIRHDRSSVTIYFCDGDILEYEYDELSESKVSIKYI